MGEAIYDEAAMLKLIHIRWPSGGKTPRYLVAEHVNNGAGFSYSRCIDAVVFNTWPSEGLGLHGLEVKVSAADFRRELQDTSKFAAFAPYLDTFSIVAPPGVVDVALLHSRWGLYVADPEKGGLRTARKPMMLHDDGVREHADRSFLAAFARALAMRGARSDDYELGVLEGRRQKTEIEKLTEEVERATRRVERVADSFRFLLRQEERHAEKEAYHD